MLFSVSMSSTVVSFARSRFPVRRCFDCYLKDGGMRDPLNLDGSVAIVLSA
jgi:hypothetical protein